MPKHKQPVHKFFFKTLEENLPQIIVQLVVSAFVLGSYVAITRTDITNLNSRVSALESGAVNRELITEKFDTINKRLDGLSAMIVANSNKIDNLKDKFFVK